jgi:uncharacterized protein (DUF2342 family)
MATACAWSCSVTRPTLASHETEIALLKQAALHRVKQEERMNDTLDDLLAEMKALRGYVESEVDELKERQIKIEGRVDKVLGNVRAFGAGMAAAFTLVGATVGAGISQLVGFLK